MKQLIGHGKEGVCSYSKVIGILKDFKHVNEKNFKNNFWLPHGEWIEREKLEQGMLGSHSDNTGGQVGERQCLSGQ